MDTKRCTKCNLVKPVSEFHKTTKNADTYRSQCKSCTNAKNRDWYNENAEARIEQTNRYQREHPEKVREYGKRYCQNHHEKRLETYRRYRETHPDERRAYRKTEKSRNAIKRCQQAKREHYLAKNRQWAQSNPDKVTAKRHRRRIRTNNASGSFTAQEWADLKLKYDYKCLCCGKAEPEILLTADHVVPLVHNGANDISNIQPLCISCNSKKHTKHTDYRKNYN